MASEVGAPASGRLAAVPQDLNGSARADMGSPGLAVCAQCRGAVPDAARHCPDCGADAGFPNVRAAESQSEAAALDIRFRRAAGELAGRGLAQVGRDFENSVASRSKAAFCRTFQALLQIAHSDMDFCVPYYKLVDAGLRNPQADAIARLRPIVDEAYFPGYYRDIRFAALTMDERGLHSYGPCTVILRNDLIARRSSVFDGNTLIRLLRADPPLSRLASLPPGHRATWPDRGKLAMAAFGGRLAAGSQPEDFPRVLLTAASDTMNDEFIEVHIWGVITARAIESVILPATGRRTDKALMQAIQEKLTEHGVRVRQAEAQHA